MKIILWDIDGTLIRSAKAGLYAFHQATEEKFGRQPDFSRITTAGMTDYYIAAQIISEVTGSKASDTEVTALVRRYEEILPKHLAEKQGYSIPPVMEILTYLHNRPDYISLLLTGNTATGARAKLTRYNLAHFFDFTASAFGDSCHDRSEVAAQALASVQTRYPNITADAIFVIGDTPNDILCGKAIGARTIAVATGTFSLPELCAHSPWWGVDRLPPPAEFTFKLAEPV